MRLPTCLYAPHQANSCQHRFVKKAITTASAWSSLFVTKDANGKFKAGSKLYNIDTSGLNNFDFVTVNIRHRTPTIISVSREAWFISTTTSWLPAPDVLSKQELNVSKVESHRWEQLCNKRNNRSLFPIR